MSGSVNRITLLGRLGAEPISRAMQSGGEVVTFSLATSERWTKNGEKQERVTWHNVCIFNEHLAKIAMQYLRKGSNVYLEGSMKKREYDKDGVTIPVWEVVLQKFKGELTLLDGRSEEGAERSASYAENISPSNNAPSGFDDDISDVPF